jgi:hypothetical protein
VLISYQHVLISYQHVEGINPLVMLKEKLVINGQFE